MNIDFNFYFIAKKFKILWFLQSCFNLKMCLLNTVPCIDWRRYSFWEHKFYSFQFSYFFSIMGLNASLFPKNVHCYNVIIHVRFTIELSSVILHAWSGPEIMNFSFSEPKMQPAGVNVYFFFLMQELVHVWPKYYSLFFRQAKKIQKYNDAGRYFVSLQNLWRVIWDYTHILK